jgi:hypothetical protein
VLQHENLRGSGDCAQPATTVSIFVSIFSVKIKSLSALCNTIGHMVSIFTSSKPRQYVGAIKQSFTVCVVKPLVLALFWPLRCLP